MIRGTLYASVAGALGWTWDPTQGLASWLLLAVLSWPLVFLLCAPMLILASVPVRELQRALQPRVRGPAYDALAVLLGCPFGLLICFAVLKFFGKTGTPWTDPRWESVMPAAVAAGAGLGWGCLRAGLEGD